MRANELKPSWLENRGASGLILSGFLSSVIAPTEGQPSPGPDFRQVHLARCHLAVLYRTPSKERSGSQCEPIGQFYLGQVITLNTSSPYPLGLKPALINNIRRGDWSR